MAASKRIPKDVTINMAVKKYTAIGNELRIIYQKKGKKYHHDFDKSCFLLYPEKENYLIIYDPEKNLTWKKTEGIIG